MRTSPPRLRLGRIGPWWFPRPLWLPLAAIQTHAHLIGVSGSGKSRLLATLFLELLRASEAVTLLDPHGDLARLVVAQLVAEGRLATRAERRRILVLDLPAAAREGRYLPFNVLAAADDPHTRARAVLEALRRAWPALDAGQAPTFENLVLAGTFVLIQHQLPLTLLHNLLVDKPWRDRLLAGISDEAVVRFFHERYDRWHREQPLLIESSLRRVFLLAFSPVLRYSLAQRENLIAFGDLFDRRRSLIVNLALPDGDARRLLGCLLTVAAEQAALARAALPPTQGRPQHTLILDEFAEFTSQSETALAHILSRCRKEGLALVLAHQTWSQASERLKGALQNAGLEIAFRLGRRDAEASAGLFGHVDPLQVKHTVSDPVADARSHPLFYSLPEQWERWVQALTTLPPQQAFLRQPGGQVTSFRAQPLPDPVVDPRRLAAIEAAYLKTYFRPQAAIEAELATLRARTDPPGLTRSESLRRR